MDSIGIIFLVLNNTLECEEMSIYQDVLDMGIKHDNHCSDLYLIDCPATHELFKKHDIKPHSVSATRFISNIDGRYWWDLPFQYEPYWENRQ